MTPEETVQPQEPPAFVAPPRAVRLVPKKPITEEERRAARQARQQTKSDDIVAPVVERAFLEKKLAGLHDAQDILRVLDTELAMQRTVRESGKHDKSRQAMRVLSISVLFALLIAALAAMGWLQSRLAQSGFSRHRTEAVGGR